MAADDVNKIRTIPGLAYPGGDEPKYHKRPFSAANPGTPGGGLRNLDFFTIQVGHIATGKKTAFEGWVTQFSDTYNSQWNAEQVYGRMDNLATFQGTTRVIQLGFDIPNESAVHCAHNMRRVQHLIQFLYPVYDVHTCGRDGTAEFSKQNVLSAAPLLWMKWTNLISSPNNDGGKLVGYINGGLSYAPDMGEGGFMEGQVVAWDTDVSEESLANAPPVAVAPPSMPGRGLAMPGDKTAIKNYFPKKLSLSFSFTVLHTHLPGWSATGAKGSTFVFGGSQEVGERYPNIYVADPAPEDIVDARHGEQRRRRQVAADAAAAAEEEDATAEEENTGDAQGFDSLTPRQRRAANRIARRNELNRRDATRIAELELTQQGAGQNK